MCGRTQPSLAIAELAKPVMVINEEITDYMYRVDCLEDLFLSELTEHVPFVAVYQNQRKQVQARLMVRKKL